MKDFSFKVPQEIVFGMGTLKKLPQILRDNGSDRVLVISDPGLEKVGAVKHVTDVLDAENIQHTSYLGIKPNPTTDMVYEALKIYQDFEATSILAIGGGGPMDVAKSVGVLAKYGGKITDYEGAHLVPGPIVPLIAIPTTAGTGSEVTAFSVIVDKSRDYKFTVFSYELLPKYALLDPEMIMSVPRSVAAACGVDAFIHASEAYVSTLASPFSDTMAEKAMELIGANIRRFVENRRDADAACAMLAGSMFAGIAFAWARLGNIHAMSHPVSAYFGVAHGVANAILMPYIFDFNKYAAADGRYEKIYNYISEEKEPVKNFKPEMLVEELKSLNKCLGIPEHLSDAGVTDEHFESMTADAMKSGNVEANPRQTTAKDIMELYIKAL